MGPSHAYSYVKRFCDVIFSASLLLLLSPVIIIISVISFFKLGRPILFFSTRVGQKNGFFFMPKFRTMDKGAPIVATHLLEGVDHIITPFGSFLRRTSLDELPQLWSILVGEMSVVGPRPALFNQIDLIELRTKNNVHLLKPGLTGWAQVNGRDNLSIHDKVEFEVEYLNKISFILDCKIIILTAIKVLFQSDVVH
ncbi:sugar transferase [Polynucleobacter sp. VK25]|nr:sugar transferase [Polynucleobacter sp. VK25]